MGREDQIIQERLKKLKELRAQGINPYPNKFIVKNYAKDLQEKYSKLRKEATTKDNVRVAGRLMSIRDFGKIAFGVLQDSTGKIQITLQEKETPEKTSEFFKKYIDSGDIIGVEGLIIRTKTGELSILIKKIEILSKSILSLPEKWHGLQDDEERYRKRYLDLTINQNIKDIFIKRALILQTFREFMAKNNFIEIETPLLQSVYGGAYAKPFITHCDAFNSDVYLSIAPELYLKKGLVGGFDRVYEITKKFRNEGVDKSHNPEHMSIEWYQSYANYEDGMDLFEQLIKDIAIKLFGKLTFEYQGHKIDLKKWKRLPLLTAIKEYLDEDINKVKTDAGAKEVAKKHGLNTAEITKVNLPDELMKLFRHKLIQPTFLIDYPMEYSPLAKPKESDPTKAEVFQPFIGGLELARAYSELNDPLLQDQNFSAQENEREAGNKEAMPTDKDFVDALKHGMPPACGVGVGIERVVMLFTNQQTIRDVILFPFMKPIKEDNKISEDKRNILESKNESGFSKLKIPISRDKAWEAVKKYNKDLGDLNHYLESEAVMRELAIKLGEDQDSWGILGLVHDIDWGLTKNNTVEHLTKAPKILKELGFDDSFIEIVLSHGYGFDCAGLKERKRTKKIEHALASAETVTGLVHAYALMRKTIEGMEAKGLRKKFNDKKFAAAIHRDIILECEKLPIPLDEFLQIAISAIQKIADQVGLKNIK